MMKNLNDQNLIDALKIVRGDIPCAMDVLGLDRHKTRESWAQVIDKKLLTKLSPDFPLMVTICGGGSSGKSTLFNSIVKKRLSPVGGSAGLNRRVLFSAHEELFEKPDFLSALFEPFGTLPRPLRDENELTTPGYPVYVPSNAIPKNLVLMDTPDFDTGAKRVYINREVSRQVLESSDILIYIFTNSNYNNRENTDFISEMLTGIGMRKCFLIYRVYPSFETQEVQEHAMTVARNLYGDTADQYVLGVYRIDEDNLVASGEKFMTLRPVEKKDPLFLDALKNIDAEKLRLELLSSILNDVLDQAQEFLEQIKISSQELHLYLDALQTAQSHCVHEALQHFPVDRVMKRFVEIWMATDPPFVKAMRKTGNIIELPFKVLVGTAKKIKGTFSDKEKPVAREHFIDAVKEDLMSAANQMHYQTLNSEISVSAALNDPVTRRMANAVEEIRAQRGLKSHETPRKQADDEKETLTFIVSAHPVVFPHQETLRQVDWKSIQQSIMSQQEVISELSHNIENDLINIAAGFRSKMGTWTKIRQMFAAFLNVVPATVAVTYILSTGDPVGAVGIKVKLSGLFGLHDLYALIAIPATTGLKKADQNQLKEMLAPIIQTWLNNKLKSVQYLFEKEITGQIIQYSTDALQSSDALIIQIQDQITVCKKAFIS
jgi:GTPase Era involved in 16S rRNA processing